MGQSRGDGSCRVTSGFADRGGIHFGFRAIYALAIWNARRDHLSRFQHPFSDAFCLGCGKGGVVNIGAAVPCGDGFVFRVFRAAAKVGIAADIRLPKWRATQSRFSPAKRAWLQFFTHSSHPVSLPSVS